MNRMETAPQDVASLAWDRHYPFIIEVTVATEDIDHLQHANNAAYLRWLERCAWAHSNSVGLKWSTYERLNAAFVVHRHELDYLAATYLGQRLAMGTWVTANDGRLTLWRHFQIVRCQDGETVFRAASCYVCTRLDNGRPRRMPHAFVEGYKVADDE